MYRRLFAVTAILIIILFVLCFVILIIDYRIKRKKREAIFINLGHSFRKNKLIQMYHFLSRLPMTKEYLNRISRRYEILCPGDKREVARKSISFAFRIWGISAAMLLFVFFRKPSLFNACISILLVWVVNSELTYGSIRRCELRILKQLDLFLSDVRHYYYMYQSVDEAIHDSMELAGEEMKIHANKIYEVITSENLSEEVNKYNDTSHNNYLKMFLAQCVSAIDYGDKILNKESLFLSNIKNLKIDINVEIIKLNKIKFLFLGINSLIIAPVLFLDVIRKWAVSNIPELYNFYYGKTGIILIVLFFVWTIILYIMIGYLRENHPILQKDYSYLEELSNITIIKIALENYNKKHFGKMEQLRTELKKMGENITPKQLMVKQILYAVAAAVIGIILFINLHSVNRHNILNNTDNMTQLTVMADEKQIAEMKKTVSAYVKKYRNQRNVTINMIERKLKEKRLFQINNRNIENVKQEIIKRINEYQKEYLKWYEVIIVMILSYLAYYFPYYMIIFRKNIMKMNMNDEVIQFQSIILMLMYIDRITVSKILEFMEAFAVIFKDSIRTCLNNYDSGDIEALNQLKEKEKFIPFQRLVDDFLISDKIGLEQAFDEIAVDRANFTEQRKQDNEIHITNKGTLAKYIGYFHLVLVIIIYLAIPFIVESLRQFQQYNVGINNLS